MERWVWQGVRVDAATWRGSMERWCGTMDIARQRGDEARNHGDGSEMWRGGTCGIMAGGDVDEAVV